MQPFGQIAKSVPCQMQLPIIWPSEGNLPQVVMIVMNQAMRQLAIDEPRQAFRQPNYAEPNRAWKEPNQVPEPNRAWKELSQVPEPNGAWKEPYYAFEPNQAWHEPNHAWKAPNQVPTEPKEPDRGTLVHSGKTPLCKRFTNFQKPVLELKEHKIVDSNKHDLSKKNQCNLSTENQCDFSAKNQSESINKSFVPVFCHNQSIDSPGTSKLNQNQHQPKISLCEERGKIQNSNSYSNIAKKSPEEIEPKCVFMPNDSNSDFDQKNYQNLTKPDQGLYRQSLTNKAFFGQNQTNKEVFGQSQTNKELFRKSYANKELFGQGLSKHQLFGQKGIIGQSQINKNLYEQSQTKQLFMTSQTCSEIFPNLQSNPFKKLIAENSTLKQSAKDVFSKSPQSNVEIPSCFEEKRDTNAKEKSALTLDYIVKIAHETDLQNLDKNDLRRILMEKKRKSNVLETTNIAEGKYNTISKLV